MSAEFELRGYDGSVLRVVNAWSKVGRADSNDIVLPDPTVSRHHLNLYIKEGHLIAEDAGSQNGFLVNGKLVTQASALNPGDRLTVGSSEYVVQLPGAPEASRPADGQAAASNPLGFGAAVPIAAPSAPNRRVLLYGAVAVVLVAMFIANRDESKAPPGTAEPSPVAKEIPLNPQGFRPERQRAKSLSEIQSAARFVEGKRDYDNANYGRALLAFEESRTLNPENESAVSYIQLAEARLKAQIETLQLDAERSFNALQYSRAKGQAMLVLTILSEQVPGYGRRIAQENAVSPDTQRLPGQDETMLKIPCARTRYADLCEKALKVIKGARQQLGEEDTLR